MYIPVEKKLCVILYSTMLVTGSRYPTSGSLHALVLVRGGSRLSLRGGTNHGTNYEIDASDLFLHILQLQKIDKIFYYEKNNVMIS